MKVLTDISKKVKVGVVSLQQDIVLIEFTPNIQVTGDDALEILVTRTSFPTPNTKQLVLADIRTNPQPEREARDFAKKARMNATTQALALLVDNQLSRLLGNFFVGFQKGKYPVKLFTST